ncbi:MAG TPA: hypothetical protein VEI97_09215, partial [bacterium]|nr:hypothetical protein [bacterium]
MISLPFLLRPAPLRGWVLLPALLALLVLTVLSPARAQTWQWAAQTSGQPNSMEIWHQVARDGSGNLYTVGAFDGPSAFGPATLNSSMMDGVISKLNANGSWQWSA